MPSKGWRVKKNNLEYPKDQDGHGWSFVHPKDPPKVGPTIYIYVDFENAYFKIRKDLRIYRHEAMVFLIDASLHQDNMLQRVPEQYRRRDRILDEPVAGIKL